MTSATEIFLENNNNNLDSADYIHCVWLCGVKKEETLDFAAAAERKATKQSTAELYRNSTLHCTALYVYHQLTRNNHTNITSIRFI